MFELTSANVDKIFTDVLCEPENPNSKVLNMIANKFCVDTVKLESYRQEVADMLNQLPTEFLPQEKGGGNGWSFLQACDRRDGVQWTGFHIKMEALFTMGLALKMVGFMLPREMWILCPGSVPYFIVDTDGVDESNCILDPDADPTDTKPDGEGKDKNEDNEVKSNDS